MARAYAGAAGTHMFLGLLSIAAGVTWICLLYFYEDLMLNTSAGKVSILENAEAWVSVIMSTKIICGFWVSHN